MLRFSFSVSWGCAPQKSNVEVSFSANTWPMELPLKLVVEGNITFRSFEENILAHREILFFLIFWPKNRGGGRFVPPAYPRPRKNSPYEKNIYKKIWNIRPTFSRAPKKKKNTGILILVKEKEFWTFFFFEIFLGYTSFWVFFGILMIFWHFVVCHFCEGK